jgi:hypothetical protein
MSEVMPPALFHSYELRCFLGELLQLTGRGVPFFSLSLSGGEGPGEGERASIPTPVSAVAEGVREGDDA